MQNQNNFQSQAHAQSAEQLYKDLDSRFEGLKSQEAQSRVPRYGPNELEKKEGISPVFVFFRQFNSALIYILALAAIISYIFEHYVDVYVIIFVVLVNAVIGFIQEHKAEKAVEALGKMIVPSTRVYRDGRLTKMLARDLVPGDVVFLEEGDRIPADARLLYVKNFRTAESALTGESSPITKITESLSTKTVLADQANMVWMGTLVVGGQARALVTATGNYTALGSVAKSISGMKNSKSHFQKKVDKLAKQMGAIAILGAAVTFLIGFFFRGLEFSDIFLATIASLVSGIPEGLPAILVIVLAVSAVRMSKKNAIVRSLPATETLGIVTTIMTDKTGTLTQNTLNVRRVFIDAENEFQVTGSGWDPQGKFIKNEKPVAPLENVKLARMLHILGICNNARVLRESNEKKDQFTIMGDPTEAALVVLAEKAGLTKDVLDTKETRIEDMPFQSSLSYRATLVEREEKKREIYAVGAPEAIAQRVNFISKKGVIHEISREEREAILEKVENWSREAIRVIAIAYKANIPAGMTLADENVSDLVFVGLVGMIDTPRPEAKDAVKNAQRAGIRVIMTTGDHKATACAIAKEVNILEDKNVEEGEAYTEQELSEMSEREFSQAIQQVNVFARLTPKMKLRITEELQRQGEVVAVTGDGVNDALALKKADIGISMGKIGTDVARQSSEIILADDNFASIVKAIEEGRIVFSNARKASSFLITTNFAEHVTIIGSLSIGLPLPLLPTQILWLNLVTEGLPDVALAAEPGHGHVLKEAPRTEDTDILSRSIIPFVLLMAGVMAVLSIAVFFWLLPDGLEKARAGVFSVMAWTQLFNVFNMRSTYYSAFTIGFFTNKYLIGAFVISALLLIVALYVPWFQNIFQFASLGVGEFIITMILSSSVFWLGEIYKIVRKKGFSG